MPNSIFKKIPLLRVFIPFSLGIIAASYTYLIDLPLLGISIVAFIIAIIGWKLKHQPNIFLVSGLFIFFLAAGAFQYQHKKFFPKQTSQSTISGILSIESAPVSTKNRIKYTAAILTIKQDSILCSKGKLIAYFPKDSLSRKLEPGDQVFFQGRLSKIKNSNNPGAFEMQKYYASKQISHFLFIEEKSWQAIPGETEFKSIQLFARSLRYKMIKKLKQHMPDRNNRAVIEALSLGYKSELSPETKSKFADAGAMHFLAVSGLHVGIIYLLLAQLLKVFGNSYRARKYKILFIIAGLWGYAFITGLSPSVTRATIMFTFFSAGKVMQRETQIYNTILASALIMLWFQPILLFDVGFQLSYAAVISIVFFYPKIEALFTIKNGLLKKIWQLTALSLSAQVGTFPLTIFYFSQFPVYFLISNLLVMPLVVLILYATAVFFMFTWWEMAAELTALFLTHLTHALNTIVFYIHELPWSLLKNLNLDGLQIFMLYAAIAGLMSWFVYKSVSRIAYTLIFLILFFIATIIQKIEQSNQKDFIVYQSSHKSLYSFVEGNTANIIHANMKHKVDSNETKYILTPHQIKYGIKKKKYMHQGKLDNDKIYKFNDQKILFIHDNYWKKYYTEEKYAVDLIVMSSGCFKSIDVVLELFDAKSIILDSSIYGWKLKRIKEQLEKKGISYHAVSEEGAYRLSEKHFPKNQYLEILKKESVSLKKQASTNNL